MADRDRERGEAAPHQRPRDPREPQEEARPNTARSKDDQGRDSKRPGSESGGGR